MDINLLIGMESSFIDYKEALEESKPKSWLKTVSAFANSWDGYIIFGVRDNDFCKVGLSDCQRTADKISELINKKIKPVPNYTLELANEDNKDFIILTVNKGRSTPYYYTSDGTKIAYVRRGNQSIVAVEHELHQLILDGQGKTYDALPSQFTLSRGSFTLLEATYNGIVNQNPLDKDKDLYSFGLIDEQNVLTNAGALLCDQGLLKHSRVFCTRWNGLNKGTVALDAIDDKEYSGSLLSLLDNAVNFVRNNSKTSWRIRGLLREEVSDYPESAVREAIVNALIHRDYTIVGSEIHIDMYDDRMEIYSPGGMVNGWRIQDINIFHLASIRRNPILADVFNRMKLMDRRGSGLTRILLTYENDEKKPKFLSEASSFFVVFPSRTFGANNMIESSEKDAQAVTKSVMANGGVNNGGKSGGNVGNNGGNNVVYEEEIVLSIILRNPSITMPKISEEIGVSLRTVERIIKKLKSKGIIERQGTNRKGMWIVDKGE